MHYSAEWLEDNSGSGKNVTATILNIITNMFNFI